MVKKSFWQRGEDYAEKVSGELIEQIKRGVAPWQKPWKPGEPGTPKNFSTGKKYSGGNSLYLMSRASARDGATTDGAPTTRSSPRAGRFARASVGRECCSSRTGRQDDLRGRAAGKADL